MLKGSDDSAMPPKYPLYLKKIYIKGLFIYHLLLVLGSSAFVVLKLEITDYQIWLYFTLALIFSISTIFLEGYRLFSEKIYTGGLLLFITGATMIGLLFVVPQRAEIFFYTCLFIFPLLLAILVDAVIILDRENYNWFLIGVIIILAIGCSWYLVTTTYNSFTSLFIPLLFIQIQLFLGYLSGFIAIYYYQNRQLYEQEEEKIRYQQKKLQQSGILKQALEINFGQYSCMVIFIISTGVQSLFSHLAFIISQIIMVAVIYIVIWLFEAIPNLNWHKQKSPRILLLLLTGAFLLATYNYLPILFFDFSQQYIYWLISFVCYTMLCNSLRYFKISG
jgi:hypothetical protein